MTDDAESATPVELDPVELYALLAAGVAGRGVELVTAGDERSWSDGEKLFVGEGLDPVDVRDAVIVQAAMLAAGSFEPLVVARLAGRRRLRWRYLTLEAQRACSLLADVVPAGTATRVAGLHDGRLAGSPAESLDIATSPDVEVQEAPAWLGTLKPARIIRAAPGVGRAAATEQDSLSSPSADKFRELDDEEEQAEESKILKLFEAPGMQSRLSQYLQQLLGMGRSAQSDGAGGAEMPVASSRAGSGEGGDGRRVEGDPAVEFLFDVRSRGRTYPEWDLHREVYRPDWCTVSEWDPPSTENVEPIRGEPDDRLQRELARLGLAHERHRRQEEGDVLDVTALVEMAVRRRCGMDDGERRVYETRRRTAHDLGVLILLDATGSTGSSEAGRRAFDQQRELAARITRTLESLGDRVATYAFRSWGRGSVQFLRVKSFDDRFDAAAHRRLGAVEPSGFTRLGAAVRHATWMLSERSGTTNNLLVVVGDGLPYDDGYEHLYAESDARRSLDEAVDAGVGCACVSVGSGTDPDLMQRVWGHVPCLALEDPSEFAQQVTPVFRLALKEAAASRRRIS